MALSDEKEAHQLVGLGKTLRQSLETICMSVVGARGRCLRLDTYSAGRSVCTLFCSIHYNFLQTICSN